MTPLLSNPARVTPLLPVLLAIMVGAFLVAYKIILRWFPPFTAMTLVMAGTSATLAVLILWRSGPRAFRVSRKHLGFLLLLGFCGAVLNNAMLWSLELGSASNASLLLRSDLLFSAVIGWVFFGENLTLKALEGLLIMCAGALLVLEVFPWQLQVVVAADLLALLAGFLLATNAVIIKFGLKTVRNQVIAFYNTLMIAFYSLLLVVIQSDTRSLWVVTSQPALNWTLLAVLLSAGQFILYYRNLKLFPIWIVRALLLVSPFVTLLLSQWILWEEVGWNQWLGGLLLAFGGALLLRQLERKSGTSSSPLLSRKD